MQVSVEVTQGLERKMTVVLPPEPLETKINQRLKELEKTVEIKGFRRGKVPSTVVKKQFGSAVSYEVAEEFMRESLGKAFEEQSLEPAGMPQIEPKPLIAGQPFEYIATFEVYPEFDLQPLDGVEFTRYKVTIEDEDIENVLQSIRKQHVSWKEVSRKAALEDKVDIDFAGKVDGETIEGGVAEHHSLVLGSGNFIPGFEEQLVGHAAGEKFTVTVNFPTEYHANHLAGKAAEFAITLHKVEEPVLPEVNNEFASMLNVKTGTVESLKQEIRQNLEREVEDRLVGQLKKELFDKLAKLNPIDLPKTLIKGEAEQLRKDFLERTKAKMSASDLPADLFNPEAERRVHVGLLLRAGIEKYALTASPEQVTTKLNKMASVYQDSEAVLRWYKQQPDMLSQINALILEEQLVEKLLEVSKVVEESMRYQDFAKKNQAQAGEHEHVHDENCDHDHDEHVHDENCQHEH